MAIETDPKQGSFLKEDRYLVFKRSDIDRYLNNDELGNLMELIDTIEAARRKNGKRTLSCVVVEDDWPMYDSTWKAIEAWSEKQNAGSNNDK